MKQWKFLGIVEDYDFKFGIMFYNDRIVIGNVVGEDSDNDGTTDPQLGDSNTLV